MTTASLIGDSQAGGLAGPLAAALQQKGIVTLREYHRNGGSTARVLDEGGITDVVSRGVPDVLFVSLGGNDGPASATAWGRLLEEARRAGITRVIWIGPPASPDPVVDVRRLTVSDAQRAFFVGKPGVQWFSGRELAQGLPRADDVHLTHGGYLSYAQRIVAAFSSSGSGLVTAGLAALALWGSWKIAERWSRT